MAKRKRRISFKNWCKKDPNDERLIHYTVHYWDGCTYKFTSDYTNDKEDVPVTIWWLSEHAMVDKVELIDNEWYIELSGRK